MRIRAIFIVIFVVLVVVFVVIGIVHKRHQVCEDVQVELLHSGKDVLLSEQDIQSLLKQSHLILEGSPMKEIKKVDIEKALQKNCWFDKITELSYKGNVLVLKISVKHPFLMVFTHNGASYYIDDNGNFLPYSDKVTEEMLVLNGNIKTTYSANKTIKNIPEKSIKEAFEMAKIIQKDNFFRSNISQILINQENELELYGRFGQQVILVGHVEKAAEKLENLKLVYQEAMVYLNPNTYKQIDLRYTNRIVATRR